MSTCTGPNQPLSESDNKCVKNYTVLKGHKGAVNCMDTDFNNELLFSGSEVYYIFQLELDQ